LLSEPPYGYNSVTIGLFALIGIGAMLFGPFYSKAVIDRYVPLLSVILGLIYSLVGVLIGTFTGTFTVAGPISKRFSSFLSSSFQKSSLSTISTSQEPSHANLSYLENNAD